MHAETVETSAPCAAALLQQDHCSCAGTLTYAVEKVALTLARKKTGTPRSWSHDSRQEISCKEGLAVIHTEETNICRHVPASSAPSADAFSAAATTVSAPACARVAAPAAVSATAAAGASAAAPAPAAAGVAFAATSPAAGASFAAGGVAAEFPAAYTPAGALLQPVTSAACRSAASPARVHGAAVTSRAMEGAQYLAAASSATREACCVEAAQRQHERVHGACSRTVAGPTPHVETSSSNSSKKTSLRSQSFKEYECVGRPRLIGSAEFLGPLLSAAAITPETSASSAVPAGGVSAAAISIGTARAAVAPLTAVCAAAAEISAAASAPHAPAGMFAAVARDGIESTSAAAFASVAPAAAGRGGGAGEGSDRLPAGLITAAHRSPPWNQLCGHPSTLFSSSAGATGDMRHAGFTSVGREARHIEKRLASSASATSTAAVNALYPSRLFGDAAAAAAAVADVVKKNHKCRPAAASAPGDDAAAAAVGRGALFANDVTAATATAFERRQGEGYSCAAAPPAAPRVCKPRSQVSAPPGAAVAAARSSSFPHSHRGTWRCLRSSAAAATAAAAAVCLICVTAAEAIVCRIDASDGLLAAAVAAGSAMPAAEVFSFPLCRLPYLVNSDVPARDAPHIGLYSGGSIEIELELLPSESYANNLPLSEPRFHQRSGAADSHRQPDMRENEGAAAAAAASSPKRKQQQTGSPSGISAPTEQQGQQQAATRAAGGSVARELAAVADADVGGAAAASSALAISSSTGTKTAAARREGRGREEGTAAAPWGTATGRDATGRETAAERATEERRERSATETEQEDVALEGQRTGGAATAGAETESRHTVPAAWGSPTAERIVDVAGAPKEEESHEENGETEDREGVTSFSYRDEGKERHSPSATEDVENSQRAAPHALRDAAAENSLAPVSAVQAAPSGLHRAGDGGVAVAAESLPVAGRSIAGASSSICPASEGNVPVTPFSGSPRVLEPASSPSLFSLYSRLLRDADAAATFVSSSLQHMWNRARRSLALFAYSVVAAADLFFGTQASPLLLPASSRTSSRAHFSAIPFSDTDRAALPEAHPTTRPALPFSLLFSSLYSAAPFFGVPAPKASGEAATHQQRKEAQQQQEKQRQRETEQSEEEQQQLVNAADNRDSVTESGEVTTGAAAEAEEEAKEENGIFRMRRESGVAGGVQPLASDADRDVGAVGRAEAPTRNLQESQSDSVPRLHAVAGDEAEKQREKENERLAVQEEGEEGKEFGEEEEEEEEEEGEAGESTDADGIAEGQTSRSLAAGESEMLRGAEREGSYTWGEKGARNTGETFEEDFDNIGDAREELRIPQVDHTTASYEAGYVRAARWVQQQEQRQEQIAAAAAAWQRQLRQDNPGEMEDPLVHTVNNTYVLVMSHFQYMVYQQDSGWLRSFTATDGIVANSYVPAFKRLTFTGPKLHARVEVPKLDRYAVVLLNADGLDLRLKGRITFLNPGDQQLSVEQIPLPKLLLFLMLLHLLTVAVLAIVMLSFRRRRWSRIHFLILSNLLLCALCFTLDRSQTVFFEEHGQRNPILWLAARVCKKLQDIMALMVFILIALGWKTLRSQLTRIEVQFVAGLCVISLYLGLFEIILGGFQGTRYILHALGYVCVLVAINFNLAVLHSHIMDAGITATTSDLYHKYDAFRLYRGIFFLYLLKPVSLIFFKLSFLNPIYEQLLSWDEWIFVFANNAIDYGIFLSLFYAFRPGGTMRILREVSQVTASETRSDQPTNVNAWPTG